MKKLAVYLLMFYIFTSIDLLAEKHLKDSVDYVLYFTGDIAESENNDIVDLIIKDVKANKYENHRLLMLGNNISKKFYDISYDDLNSNEIFIKNIKSLRNSNIEFSLLPGSHEWSNGWEDLHSLNSYANDFLQAEESVFLTENACPGIKEVPLTDSIVLLAVDSQWWLQADKKPLNECGIETVSDLMIDLNDAILRNQNKKIIIASYNPIYSAGIYGGNYKIPSPYSWYHKYVGASTDFVHPLYKQYRYYLSKLFSTYKDLIILSSHENNMQLINQNNNHYLICSGGGKPTYVNKKKASFAKSKIGYSRIVFMKSNEIKIDFIEIETDKSIFTTKLNISKKHIKEFPTRPLKINNDTVHIAASEQYLTNSKLKKSLLGSNYRKEWAQKVNAPVFDIGKQEGGLKIVKRGGGQQTRSLRLEASNGEQFVLRSIEKYTERAIPEQLQGTIAAEIVQDGISESHPYAFLTIPKMAEAIGVYHTDPKIVFLPDDERFQQYNRAFKNALYLYEQRPNSKQKNRKNFGNPYKVWGTDKLLEKLSAGHDIIVDQDAVLKARIFDIFINDWDRHDDQWRWAIFKESKNSYIARPIPRDRDQVYFYGEGILPWIVRRKWVMPKFQSFGSEIENVNGLGFNSRYFDRHFLNGKSRTDWLETCKYIQNNLTDSVIESAVRDLPEEIFAISGEKIINKLKKRRDNLSSYINEFYSFLSKKVDVACSNKRDLVRIKSTDDDKLRLRINHLNKEGKKKKKVYDRVFDPKETKEINIYTLDGKDKFELKNDSEIKLRLIGGKSKDKYKLENTRKKNIYIYDTKKSKITDGAKFKSRLSKHSKKIAYNRKDFKYNVLSPNVNMNYISEDGFILGLGMNMKTQAFQKAPYATKHSLMLNYAFAYPSVSVDYSGELIGVGRNLDFVTDVHYNTPNFKGYYYGLGNKTENDKSKDDSHYRIKMLELKIKMGLKYNFNDNISFTSNLYYQHNDLKETKGYFITDFDNKNNDLVAAEDFKYRKYFGIHNTFSIDTRNSKALPSRGIKLELFHSFNRGIRENDHNFQKYKFDFRSYLGLGRVERMVVALRCGGAHNTKGYNFYQANKLGMKSNLRGYRQNRFSGDDILYANIDLRYKIGNFKTFISTGSYGMLVFSDMGRVWYEGEKSKKWHHGKGVGFWLAPFDMMALNINYASSSEDEIFSFAFKYLF
ncbi:MAG: outer membrane protein assembly factor [Marinifilaceae bacterium]|jgi:hypothetical protein|nr:outer membrane protein assembly factor [Marinifilaceae bacterium]